MNAEALGFSERIFKELGLASPEARYRVIGELGKRFPQMNDRTSLIIIDAKPPEVMVRAVGVYSVPVRRSGWQARLWRVVGELAANQEWTARGWNKNAAISHVDREYRVEHLAWNFPIMRFREAQDDYGFAFFCYIPEKDELFIWRRADEVDGG